MAYKRIARVEILEVMRRYFEKQNISQISEVTGLDRKTVRRYIKSLRQRGITEYDREKIIGIIEELIPKISGRPKTSCGQFEFYTDEIVSLINNPHNPLKPKTAFEIITERHELNGKVSYSSFKRFIRSNKLIVMKDKSTCRLEYDPGEQVQIDYAKVGTINDPLSGKRKTVYAFIGTLSYSRYKFVEFVYSQNQQSFVNSHVKMFNFFGGNPKVIVLDNLKSGVIKPDLYNPMINKSYSEMAEYYECFINPCRVAAPKDKGIVERDVQTVREQFKKLKAINNNVTIAEANKSILDWLKNVYGLRCHGTTHQKPYEEFTETGHPALQPLPTEPFEAALWKEAVVHPDHYIQVNKKAYSVPHQYVGKKVMVKVSHNLVSVYYSEQLIKQHTIPKGYRQTDLNDFPENMKSAIDSGLPLLLRKRASKICDELGMLIDKILSPHAFINMRKAQGILSVAEKHPIENVSKASMDAIFNYRRVTPQIFLSLIEREPVIEEQINISEETSSFIRKAEYFINNN
jgi:transposase